MTLYLGENLISGVATPTEPTRNIGQIIESIVPLTDAGLHLLDGALINGSGIYSAFVDYIADLYANTSVVDYKNNITVNGSLIVNDCVISGFTSTSFASVLSTTASNNNSEYVFCFTTGDDITGDRIIAHAQPIVDLSIYNGYISFYNYGDSTHSSIVQATANTKYWVKETINGTSKSYSYSTDGETWSSPVTATDSATTSAPTYGFRLGQNSNSTYATDASAFNGTIDLSECYGNIDGQLVWIGANEVKPMFCTEEQWQSSVTTYGVCGKFVYDSTNNTVRLPKITGITEGTTDLTALGDLVQAGLPNITGTYRRDNSQRTNSGNWDGCFYPYDSSASGKASGDSSNSYTGHKVLGFDASRSSNIYGQSNTVQPQTIKVLYYIVIATTAKTEIEVDIDEISTDLNGKADVDLSNLSNGLANTICTTKATTTSTASNAIPAVIVENYVNGTSWYRVYSDGWCEQGDSYASTTSNSSIALLKNYVDTNYSVFIMRCTTSSSSTTTGGDWWTRTKTTSSFTPYTNQLSSPPYRCCWYTCGYIR